LLNVYITKIFLHNLSRHVSALSWAIFKCPMKGPKHVVEINYVRIS